MPAAAVIPAPIAYIKVAAVKKARSLNSGLKHFIGQTSVVSALCSGDSSNRYLPFFILVIGIGFYFEKITVFQ